MLMQSIEELQAKHDKEMSELRQMHALAEYASKIPGIEIKSLSIKPYRHFHSVWVNVTDPHAFMRFAEEHALEVNEIYGPRIATTYFPGVPQRYNDGRYQDDYYDNASARYAGIAHTKFGTIGRNITATFYFDLGIKMYVYFDVQSTSAAGSSQHPYSAARDQVGRTTRWSLQAQNVVSSHLRQSRFPGDFDAEVQHLLTADQFKAAFGAFDYSKEK